MHRTLAITLALYTSLALAEGPAPPVVPISVQSVMSGGYWKEGNRSGTYRVVIERLGWEHLWSRLFVEWVTEPRGRDDPETVLAVIEPTLPFVQGTTLLDAKIRRLGVGRLEIVVDGIPNDLRITSKRARVVLEAGAPGQVKLLSRRPAA